MQENVDMMAKYIGLDKFKAIYVVDLCHSLCEVAKEKAKAKGWKNVHVVEADACAFEPAEGQATLITYSYSLTSESCRTHARRRMLGLRFRHAPWRANTHCVGRVGRGAALLEHWSKRVQAYERGRQVRTGVAGCYA